MIIRQLAHPQCILPRGCSQRGRLTVGCLEGWYFINMILLLFISWSSFEGTYAAAERVLFRRVYQCI
jgi:hypothetical protein